ncbi:MAG: septum formation inhibitor Maf [Lachnospiraceae bacterium]|nr:septum formation inhibitor Maf [Lachnospiraceae bacterium]
MKIILASASPRRRELLAGLGLDYTVLASGVEEQITEKEPAKVVEELSAQKAGDVLQRLLAPNFRKGDDEELLVIGADTIVSIEGQILGKPADERDGAEMLKRLSGRQHQVYTGVTLYHWHRGETRKCTFHECTQVWFYPMTQEEISWYISTGEPMDKAGAYGIQGLGNRFVKAIEGDYNNVVGLPVARLYQELKALKLMENISR